MELCSKVTVKKTGLNVWASGEHNGNAPNIDIVAVQGLGAHPYYTWVKKPDKMKSRHHHGIRLFSRKKNAFDDGPSSAGQTVSGTVEIMWLRDVLPNLIPYARIATYSYESDWRKADIKTSLRNCGEQLLNVLHQNRTEKERPLVFIGHSLGGLIIKQALVLADHGETLRDIRLSTAGIVFLGTPHQGSDAAVYGAWLAHVVGNDKTLLESLKKNSTELYHIAKDFEASYRNADMVCYYESKDVSYGPWQAQLVHHQSASLLGKRAMYLSTDHSGLNKFHGPSDENFLLVWPEIDRMVKQAPQKVKDQYSPHAVATEIIRLPQNCRDDQEAKLLEDLASDYKSDKDSVSKRVPGTCEWFFHDTRFLDWRDSVTSRLLWVSAGPGCGKSVLAKTLVDERRLCMSTAASTVCYFFFKDGQEQRTSGVNALSALLHQLFETSDLITYALDSYRSHGKELRNRFSELWRILVKSAEDSKAGHIICVLDALDECEEKARSQLIDQLIQFFSHEESSQNPSLKLKFLVTSRPYDDLELSFERLLGISTYMRFDGTEKSQEIAQEINLVIDAKVPYFTGGFNNTDRKRICTRLKEMENRTYLWIFLTIDIIEKTPSKFRRESDIESLLSNLPSEISDAYDRILQRSTDKVKARILLELIVTATRPLSLEEANMALAIATGDNNCKSQRDLDLWPIASFKSTVENWCGLFVSVHDGKLFLIHQTAREFLTRTSTSPSTLSHRWEGCISTASAHGTMSRICLDYLQFQDVASINRSAPDESEKADGCYLLDYAARHWTSHYKSQPAEFAKGSQNAAMSLCDTSSTLGYWFRIYCAWKYLKPLEWTCLGVASYLGLANLVRALIDEGVDMNAQVRPYGSALVAAVEGGHDQIVRMLLDNGSKDVNGYALLKASSNGHDQIVRILLDSGSEDVNGEALSLASSNGYDQIVRMLLDSGSKDVNGLALRSASSNGHDQIVQMLLDNGSKDVNGYALQWASSQGHDQIVRLLLDSGSKDVDSEALEWASSSGHDQIVQMLLASGSKDNGKALGSASLMGHDQIVRMLLASGSKDVDGKALGRASSRGHDQIVRILLDKRRDDYAQDGKISDALGRAMDSALWKHRDGIVQILQEFQRSFT